MKKLIALLISAVALGHAWAGGNDVTLNQRNDTDTSNITRVMASPPTGVSGFFAYNGTTKLPVYLTVDSTLSVTSGIVSVSTAIQADWNATTGRGVILNRPSFATLAFTGQYADLFGQPMLGTAAALNVAASGNAAAGEVVKGSDGRLTDARAPTAHTHLAIDVSNSTAIGRAMLTAADQAGARTAIGAGTSSFSGAWPDLSSRCTTLAGCGIVDAYPLTGNPSGFLTSISGAQITTALGYTPYNGASNPNNYVTTSSLSAYATTASLASYATTASLGSYVPASIYTTGLAGKEATITAGTTAQYWRGDKTWQTLQAIQRVRGQSTTAGVYTWTFPVAYSAGTLPVIGVTVEDTTGTTGVTWNHQITAISNTGVTITITKTNAVTLLGISVLGIATNPQAYVHITAVAP